jgi:hypothetical protein
MHRGKSCLQSHHISAFTLFLSWFVLLLVRAEFVWFNMSLPPGRPRMTINTEWLKARVSEGRDDKDIVAELAQQGISVSPKTIQRRRMEFGMNVLFYIP